jgi:hypothetical protein
MAEQDDEREVSRVYRQLPREEPPPEIDAAIRAEARSAVETHPAPLVVPTGRRQWYFPVAAAAVIILSVAVTWHVEQEQPDSVVATAPAEARLKKELATNAPLPTPESKEAAQPERRLYAPSQKPKTEAPAAEKPAERATPPMVAQSRDRMESRAAARAPIDPRPLGALGLDEAPAPWLQRIAELRRQGKHEEADRELAEFRKRYPDYVIPPPMLDQVEKK